MPLLPKNSLLIMAYQEDNTMRNALIIGASFIASLFVINAIVGPIYGVWERGLRGKAQLQEAEYTRQVAVLEAQAKNCLLYTSPSPRDVEESRMPSSA